MAKSVGNVRGLHEVLDAVGGDVLILFFSTGHYRQPLTFSEQHLEDARRSAERIRDAGRRLISGPSPDALAPYRDTFFEALRNDFNTAEALASLYGWIREANRSEEAVGNSHLVEMLDVLGLERPAGQGGRATGRGGRKDGRTRGRAQAQGLGRGGPAARRVARDGLGSPRRTGRA